MRRRRGWVGMRYWHLSEVLSWENGGITTQEHEEGRMKIIFHSGYVEFQMAPRYPADLWDRSSEEGIGSRRHII